MKILAATKNKKKLEEIKRILEPMGIDVISELDLERPLEEVEETGTTFEENAYIKAKSGLEQTGFITIADDSGLCVDFLGGKPGVYSARYSGVHGNDQKNIDKLLNELKDVKKEDRKAKFVCSIVCLFPSGNKITAKGECPGYIGFEPVGKGGFGYDPVFISKKGCFAEISAEEKDMISHRGIALKKFEEKIKKYFSEEK